MSDLAPPGIPRGRPSARPWVRPPDPERGAPPGPGCPPPSPGSRSGSRSQSRSQPCGRRGSCALMKKKTNKFPFLQNLQYKENKTASENNNLCGIMRDFEYHAPRSLKKVC